MAALEIKAANQAKDFQTESRYWYDSIAQMKLEVRQLKHQYVQDAQVFKICSDQIKRLLVEKKQTRDKIKAIAHAITRRCLRCESMSSITVLSATDTKSVYQSWERLKAMLIKCPYHDIYEHMQLYIFYHGLKLSARNVIDAAAGSSIDALTTLTQQIVSLAQKFESFQVNTQQSNQSESCDMCEGNNQNHECQATNQTDEQINVIGYKPYPFGSPMAQNHLGFQWSNPNGAKNSQSFQKQQVTDEKMESQNSPLKNLESQLSQLAALVSEKIQGPLPSNTEKNPKEHLKAITLQSGKELNEPYEDRQEKNQAEQQVDKDKNIEKSSEPSKEKEIKNKKENISEKIAAPPVTIPFPQKIKREKLDGHEFAKFMEILKQIHINIPFTDTLLQMPSYAKFLKEILSSKRKLKEVYVVMLTEKCSAILQNKLPQKLGDPGSFTIPCTLGGVYFEKALCDSGASINLMSFSIFRKLDLGEMKDISVSLQFVDQSTKKPKGIIKNMLVRVDKFVFPVDFIVLEMKECPDEPIILGRPFLATGRAIIDVHQGQLILRVDEERVIFYMQKILRFSGDESPSS
ncbi:uncharacterized protein [Nicotiana sylvestris]|uniref:uncharacterized protein n=1 Tax=Nicotiana sylvestris TaxID=4096 RepID=UPI00388CB59C